MKNRKKNDIAFDDYIKACRKASREIELERNGGRWIAKDRPHKSKKQYNRRRDRRVTLDDPFNLFTSVILQLRCSYRNFALQLR